ncbi:MAG: ATP phosphoribosyltransferase regulatory subunit [Spirochaetales bacterium]|nr:ATP phosphoribosyltransferase regulatory subunit [Spirochaetales bacterium]
MPLKSEKILNLPQGTEVIHLEEALQHRTLTRTLNDLYTSWGYLPVKTPVFDFYDNYRQLLTGKGKDNIYRLMDRDGDLLMLRSDITLFLARQMGLLLGETELPTRVCYSDIILRHQHREDISKNEFFQTGVELIGSDGLEGDMEILLLLNKTMSKLELPYYLHLGSRNLFNLIIEEKNRSIKLIEALSERDIESLRSEFSVLFTPEKSAFLCTFFQFIGNATEMKTLLTRGKDFLPVEALKEAEYLIKLSEELNSTGIKGELRLDLSEIGSQPYHTGIVFQAYMDGLDSAVAFGGRYNDLLAHFGFDAPSVGFSILLRKVEALLKKSSFEELELKPVKAEGCSWKERFENAEKLRKEGRIVTL